RPGRLGRGVVHRAPHRGRRAVHRGGRGARAAPVAGRGGLLPAHRRPARAGAGPPARCPGDRTRGGGHMAGPLALIGGSEWTEGSADDRELLAKAGGRVTVLPTAAAYENPGRAIDRARAWYEERGAELTVVPVYRRPDALDPKWCEVVGSSGYVF